jgi:hypothetical protein
MPRTKGTPKAEFAEKVPRCISELWSADAERQGIAYQEMLVLTAEPVNWADSVVTEVFLQLSNVNNRNRSIAAQLLCRLAKSDSSKRVLRDFPKLFSVVKDERFVTARHALQSMWMVACAGDQYRKIVLESLKEWYIECDSHKNCTLIRYDIIESLRKIYEDMKDEKIRSLAEELIEQEKDLKYQKKYRTLWTKKPNGAIC